MRRLLLASAVIMGVASSGAHAQGSSATQSPPSPGASSQAVNPSNSLPPAASTQRVTRPGNAVGTTVIDPAAVPARPTPAPRPMVRRPRPPAGPAVDTTENAPPTSAYQGGAGSPASTRASNITAGDTRSEIAPRLPSPDASVNTPEALLASAQRSLNAGRTGAAQQALEMAETRLLTRSTDPSVAAAPDDSRRVRAIGDARRALANRDMPGAKAAIAAAMGGA